MISLRKAIDAQAGELLSRALEAYRQTLGAVAEAGAHAYPPADADFRHSLAELQTSLAGDADAAAITETTERAGAELRHWGLQAEKYYQDKTGEVKEVLLIIADLAGQLSERDQRNTSDFGQLALQLAATARLQDLSTIRRSVAQSVRDLRTHVARMTADNQDTVKNLRTQVASYQTRLEEAERQAAHDPLTELLNRRAVEGVMEDRLRAGKSFNVILLDLNGFKKINDTLGHLAGDDLLKQFGQELKSALRSSDIVGRWGGDEFIALIDGTLQDAELRGKRIKEWVNGDYTVEGHRVEVKAAAGIATWRDGDVVASIIQRADEAMYQHKAEMSAS